LHQLLLCGKQHSLVDLTAGLLATETVYDWSTITNCHRINDFSPSQVRLFTRKIYLKRKVQMPILILWI